MSGLYPEAKPEPPTSIPATPSAPGILWVLCRKVQVPMSVERIAGARGAGLLMGSFRPDIGLLPVIGEDHGNLRAEAQEQMDLVVKVFGPEGDHPFIHHLRGRAAVFEKVEPTPPTDATVASVDEKVDRIRWEVDRIRWKREQHLEWTHGLGLTVDKIVKALESLTTRVSRLEGGVDVGPRRDGGL